MVGPQHKMSAHEIGTELFEAKDHSQKLFSRNTIGSLLLSQRPRSIRDESFLTILDLGQDYTQSKVASVTVEIKTAISLWSPQYRSLHQTRFQLVKSLLLGLSPTKRSAFSRQLVQRLCNKTERPYEFTVVRTKSEK